MILEVPLEARGERLDRWLAGALPERSRSWVTRAVESGRVTVAGEPATKAGQVLRGGETIAIRSMVYLALSYDHRIVDGADAARFLSTMKQRLVEGAFEADLGL